MLAEKGIAALPSADDPSLVLDDPEKRASVERAYARIAPMFWGKRITLDESCATIREWVGALLKKRRPVRRSLPVRWRRTRATA